MTCDLHALIVDDAKSICLMLQKLLERHGIANAEFCLNGEDALHRVERQPQKYDVLFIDLHMQGMDGLELMHQLNKIHFRGGIVVMSALNQRLLNFALEIVSNYQLKLLGSLEKPFEPSVVAFMVRRIHNAAKKTPNAERLPRRREVLSAIKQGKLLTYYQPKIAAADNHILGFECLVRLDLGARGVLMPNYFIPVVERFDLFESLMLEILRDLGSNSALIRETLGHDCHFSINLSPRQLFDDGIPERLIDMLGHFAIPRDQLTLEITENHALSHMQQMKNLNRLGIHQFRLSLDDYGAGYTNLRQIKTLPFNEIKLDASMVEGVHQDSVLKVIVESVRKVTQELRLCLVAECVNNPDDLVALADLNVDAYQGFLFCRPKPVQEVLRWADRWYHSNDLHRAYR